MGLLENILGRGRDPIQEAISKIPSQRNLVQEQLQLANKRPQLNGLPLLGLTAGALAEPTPIGEIALLAALISQISRQGQMGQRLEQFPAQTPQIPLQTGFPFGQPQIAQGLLNRFQRPQPLQTPIQPQRIFAGPTQAPIEPQRLETFPARAPQIPDTRVMKTELIQEAKKYKTAEEFVSALAKGEVINYDDVVPTKALNILNKAFAVTSVVELPEEFYGKITLNELIVGFEKLGVGEEIIKESTIALKKAGYKKIGNIILTKEGAIPEQQLTDIWKQAQAKPKK